MREDSQITGTSAADIKRYSAARQTLFRVCVCVCMLVFRSEAVRSVITSCLTDEYHLRANANGPASDFLMQISCLSFPADMILLF